MVRTQGALSICLANIEILCAPYIHVVQKDGTWFPIYFQNNLNTGL